MKKYLKVTIALLVVLVLGACGKSEEKKAETATYVAEISGAEMEAIFTHEGDTLTKVEQTMSYPYSYFGYEEGVELDDESKKALEEQVDSMYEAYKDGEGTSLDTEFGDSTLDIKMSIDLEKADPSAIGLAVSGDTKNVSFEETVKDFESQGFTKKE
jgi:uncharacterized lipoprotein YehR (DUF1307 family)